MTTALRKLNQLRRRNKVIQGGTSAGKTYGIIPTLINKAIKTPNLSISIVSETIPHLRRGAMKDFLDIMMKSERFISDRWNRSLLTYSFGNGSYIEFFSADQEQRTRGPRRDILYVNEANAVRWETFYNMYIRTSAEVWIDYNPTAEFWAHKELIGDPDTDFLVLTYLDNEAVPESLVKEIEKAREKAADSEYWANWWKVYGLGEIGSLMGAVITDWQQVDRIPKEARLLGCGIDFGYTNDPTALVAMYRYRERIYLDEVIYQSGMLSNDIAKAVKAAKLDRAKIFADHDPRLIQEIYNRGIKIFKATKGRGSINYGLDLLQQNRLYITKRSTNLIKEIRNYVWDTAKDGTTLNVPVSYMDHAIDAARYAAIRFLGSKKVGEYNIGSA